MEGDIMLELSNGFIDLDELAGSQVDIRLEAEPSVPARGAKSRIGWEVSGAEEVRVWHTDTRPLEPDLDWFGVFEAAEPVPASGERELEIDRETAVFVVARAGSEIRGERHLIEIEEKIDRKGDEAGCEPPEQLFAKMESTPHISATQLRERIPLAMVTWEAFEWLDMWAAPPAPPAITVTAPNPVIFTDESSTVTWTVSDTNCVSTGETIHITGLVADATNPSGSKYDGGGWGSGWSVGCGGGNPGSRTIQGVQGKRHTVLHVHASNAASKSGAKSQWIDTLGIPKFEGNADATRKAWVRATLKKIDAELRNGRVLSDTYLDSTVKAFKKGCLSRKTIWSRMLAELENLDITPIKCEDTQDVTKASASFESYTGRIFLRWKPGTMPSEYALCHELAHKAGFHQSLFACGLSVADIECDADHVASAILGLAPDPC
jgi:hypothetical protein